MNSCYSAVMKPCPRLPTGITIRIDELVLSKINMSVIIEAIQHGMCSIDKCSAIDWVVFSDGSVREGRAVAGVSFGDETISVRLSDGASILQAERVGI